MRLLDLTLDIYEDLPVFPGTPPVRMLPWNMLQHDGYNSEMLFLSSHVGTHMDAPYHFCDDGLRIHQIPMERLAGEAALLETRRGPNGRITRQDIAEWEAGHHTIARGSAVVFRTGWHDHLGRDDYFAANPGLSEDAAEYLAARGVGLVGTDSPSIDAGDAGSFPAHHILARSGAVNVENLANLERLEGESFRYVMLPLRIRDATASPVRAAAVL
ncbi:MAG: cyclase family protein [Nitrosopumilaceae archaeon]|nr:cyclase family protein [Nitrosopumilaceae archaeon]